MKERHLLNRSTIHLISIFILFRISVSYSYPDGTTWVAIGPCGGEVLNVLQDHQQNDRFFSLVGSGYSSLIFSSEDGGHNWSLFSTIDDLCSTIVMDYQNSSVMYTAGYYTVYKTTDAGLTWTSPPTMGLRVLDVELTPGSSQQVHASGYILDQNIMKFAYFKSTDSGSSWTTYTVCDTANWIRCMAVDPFHPDTVYIGGIYWDAAQVDYLSVLYRSKNGGQTWQNIAGTIEGSILDIVIDPGNTEKMIVSTGESIFYTTNGGTSWQESGGLTLGSSCLAMDPGNSLRVYGTQANGICRSTDGGLNWESITGCGLDYGSITALIVNQSSSGDLLAGSTVGLFGSSDSGSSWDRRDTGMTASTILSVKNTPSVPATLYAVIKNDGIYKTTGGLNRLYAINDVDWQRLTLWPNPSIIAEAAVDNNDADVVYALEGTAWGRLYQSVNGGSSWTEIGSFDNAICLERNAWLYVGGSCDHDDNYSTPKVMSVSISTNDGGNWTTCPLGDAIGKVTDIGVNPSNPQVVFAVGYNVSSYDVHVFRTVNGGTSWTELEDFSACLTGNAAAVDPFNNEIIYLGMNRGLYVSTDNGDTWSLSSVPYSVNCILPDPTTESRIFLGSGSGVIVSQDEGTTWQPLGDGLTSQDIVSLEMDTLNKVIYAGTVGGSINRFDLATGVEEDECNDKGLPYMMLLQNYPNPFNPGTEIRFSLNRAGHTDLTIFDIRGRSICILMNAFVSAGHKEVFWDGKDGNGHTVPSGIYIYRLKTVEGIVTRKMIVER